MNLSSSNPLNVTRFWNDFLSPSNIIWFLLGQSPLILSRRKIIASKSILFFEEAFRITTWLYSDSFFVLTMFFAKIRFMNIATFCKRQSLKYFGTLPLLCLAHMFRKEYIEKEKPHKMETCSFCNNYDFIPELKLISF